MSEAVSGQASAAPGASGLSLGPGLLYAPGYLDPAGQKRLLSEIAEIVRIAPPFTPRMPRTGKAFSVRMTNCGPLGWVSDVTGYRYQPTHPETGEPWPPIPEILLDAWRDLAGFPHPPQACLINLYGPEARMGLHQDRDEQEFDAPVVSLSLGATALFRIGGLNRRDKTRSLRLCSGDAFVFGGPARLVFHGIDRVIPGSSDLVEGGGRINLTLRRVDRGSGMSA